jgi:hypothetical protein
VSTEVVDDDTEAAALALWNTDTQNLPELFTVPPITGRVKQDIPGQAKVMPYATITSEKSRKPERLTGNIYFDYRKLTITVWGIRAQVVQAMGFIRALFNIETVLTYPSTSLGNNGLPRFQSYQPDPGGGELPEDPVSAQGQDVWKGVVTGEVWSTRLG